MLSPALRRGGRQRFSLTPGRKSYRFQNLLYKGALVSAKISTFARDFACRLIRVCPNQIHRRSKHEGSPRQIQCRKYLLCRARPATAGRGASADRRFCGAPLGRQGAVPRSGRGQPGHGLPASTRPRPGHPFTQAACPGHLHRTAAPLPPLRGGRHRLPRHLPC